MFFINNCVRLFAMLYLVTFLYSCQSVKVLNDGIQEGYEAINPASIIAVPVFTIPDPSVSATVDPAIIHTHQFISKLENKIMESFKGQPNINGYSFSAVNNILVKAKPDIWKNLNTNLNNISKRFSSRDPVIRSIISSSCLGRKNFVEFYSFCVAPDSIWISDLNQLALKVLNADTALLAVIKNLHSTVTNDIYTLNGGVSVLLIDTNNAKLIWGKDKYLSLTNPTDKKYFPTVEELLNSIFSDDFWDGFPGRLPKNKTKT